MELSNFKRPNYTLSWVLNEHWNSVKIVKINEIIKWIIGWWLNIIEDTWCYQAESLKEKNWIVGHHYGDQYLF